MIAQERINKNQAAIVHYANDASPMPTQESSASVLAASDRYTYLMPNPASETVTVASSFRIGEVEVYTLEGRRIIASRVDGISTTLDISQLPTGTYIVRITTNNGTAYKKLVVK